MRIVHVLYAFRTGGLEKGIATVARHASPGVEHVVLSLTTAGEWSAMLPDSARSIEMHKAPGHSFRFLWTLSRKLRDLRPDVVHTRNWVGMDGIVAARIAGIRNVVHGEHGWGMDDPAGRNARRVRVRRLVSRWVREYTCVSRQMVGWLREDVGVRKPITQIYNGVDTDRFRPRADGGELRRRLGLPESGVVVGTVGRLDPIKDQVSLIRAFAEASRDDPAARLIIIGEGPERDRLEAAAGPGVVLLGDRSDVPEILAAIDVFALPSINEGISNTILEAMASGLPVIATAVGGNPELVVDRITGVLIAPGDVGSLAAALRGYASDPERRHRHGGAGRERAVREFGIGPMVDAYERVWQRVAGGTEPRA